MHHLNVEIHHLNVENKTDHRPIIDDMASLRPKKKDVCLPVSDRPKILGKKGRVFLFP